MTEPKAYCVTYAIYGMWLLNAGHSIPEGLRVDGSSPIMEVFEEVLSVVIHITGHSYAPNNEEYTSYLRLALLRNNCS